MGLLLDIFFNLDTYVIWLVEDYGVWVYLILFLIIFCETGLVLTPFLPGDSLIFAIGTLAAVGSLEIVPLVFLLSSAAILGDSVNYSIDKYFGRHIITRKIVKEKNINKTKEFFSKYGAKTIVFARFMPIVRTFAPFLAGISAMEYRKFLTFNVVG